MKRWRSLKTFSFRIFLVALLLRLVPVVAMRDMGIGLDDMFQYDMLARSIVAGNGFRWYAQEDLPIVLPYLQLDLTSTNYDPRGVPTSFRPPLYPTFLAGIYLLAGTGVRRFFVARLVQTVLGAVLAPLTYHLARRFFPERRKIAVVAAWVVACYPVLVLYPLALATENLFFVLMLASTLTILEAVESIRARKDIGALAGRQGVMKTSGWFILAGLLLGLMALTRSVSLGLAGLVVVWVWAGLRQPKMALLVLGMVALVTLPWMVRNSILEKHLTGVESALGYDLYVGYYPSGSGTFEYPQSLDLMPMMNDGQRDLVGRQKAMEFIRADPGRFPYLIFRRAGYFFGLEWRALIYFYSNNFFGYFPPGLLISLGSLITLPFMILSASAVMGLAIIRWNRLTVLLALLIAGYITPHLLIIAEDRFHLAMVPFFAILAACCWTGGWADIKSRWQTTRGKVVICLAVLIMILLFANWGWEIWRDGVKLAQLLGLGGNQTYYSY
jgi:hypothetical protein